MAAFRKYKLVSWKKEEFEDLEDLLVSFRLYFVFVVVSSCISTMYNSLLQIYHGIDYIKKAPRPSQPIGAIM